ncbi:DegQ family serine endoprotease [Nitrospinae bacterium AH_259_B05_G02_I21]|nr:DegQ family serine endoprotease [Nitrospinae bacterium AH_259_B05_G02_I21]
MSEGIFRRFSHAFVAAALVLVWLGTVTAAELRPETFIEVAKAKKPAVVNISTTQVLKQMIRRPRRRLPGGEQDPWREFFERFFEGVPEQRTRHSLGSGIIYDKEGYIITNNHVVERASEIKVKLHDGSEYDAKVIGTDPKTDLALIKIEADKPLPTLTLGDSDALQVGEWVVAIGNPFGLEHTVTVGVVSAKGRVIGTGPYDDFIQTDASINPGNSGGPLLNTSGEVVGVNTAIVAAGQGIGFATPSNITRRVIEDLRTKGSVVRGWLGVVIQRMSPDLAKSFGLEENTGALVAEIVEDSPAQKAGIKRGDVIIKFNGAEIKTMDVLPRRVAATKPGKKATVTILRDGKKKSLKVTIGTLEEKKIAKARFTEEELGITVQEITRELAEHFDLETREGVIVSDVDRSGPAWEGGIRRGDIVLEVNRQTIKTMKDYRRALKKYAGKGTVLLLVRRGGNTLYVAIKTG